MKKRLIFGHVINHREPKGSRFVLAAVHQARMLGADFGFVFAERLPYTLATELYTHVDILIEQFVIGFYGLQACEFALMSKPVIVWLDERDLFLLPPHQRAAIPFINSPPEKLVETIIEVCGMSSEALADIGRRGKEYVKKYHSDISITREIMNGLFGKEVKS